MGPMSTDPGASAAPSRGMLLVATPALLDANFAGTVVLLLDVDDEGALGVVLNRPSPVAVSAVLGEWGELVSEPEVLFEGGPVGTDGALAVALVRAGTTSQRFRRVTGSLALVDLDAPVETVAGGVDDLRVFAGYAGWGAQQLRDEIAEGSWFVVAAEPRDVFGAEVDDLWREVLRRQPGELAWRSTQPADPGQN